MPRPVFHLVRAAGASLVLAWAGLSLSAAEPTAGQVQELIEQNRQLQEHVRAQQRVIDELNARMGEVLRASERHEQELRGLEERIEEPGMSAGFDAPDLSGDGREVRIGAEGALAYFKTGPQGQFPNGEFRVDDPMISLEAPVARNVYFYTELKLLTRETNDEDFQLGEIYIDFENVSALWGQPGLLSARAGRLNIPFGEEYLVRGPLANPLISHSLSDLWGCDEGVEVYGRIGPAQYVVAVQNGGASRLRDYNSDKSVTARVSWQPARWLRVSGSAMRTGKLATEDDRLSELWFGDAFFRAIGPEETTATFETNLFQADATARWKSGHVSVALGQARYDDSDTQADNSRRLRYGYLEVAQDLWDELYAAVRYSEIRAPGGYPLAGWGRRGQFFFRPGMMTEQLRRMSVGLGYRFGPPLVLKVEYSWESGRMTTGAARDHEDFFGTQLGMEF